MKTLMKVKGILVFTVILTFSLNGMAQEKSNRFGFELTAGPSFATKDLADEKLKTGLGFEGLLHYRFIGESGIYIGWGWNKFAAEESFAGSNIDFEETGYIYGLQFKQGVLNNSLSYFVRVGGLYNHIEVENENGDIIGDTGHGMGWQVAGGVEIGLGAGWLITPGIKFNSLSRELEMNEITTQLDLNYLNIRIGILKTF